MIRNSEGPLCCDCDVNPVSMDGDVCAECLEDKCEGCGNQSDELNGLGECPECEAERKGQEMLSRQYYASLI